MQSNRRKCINFRTRALSFLDNDAFEVVVYTEGKWKKEGEIETYIVLI
jgi:hypothetical protein